jgi:hypothetical protein
MPSYDTFMAGSWILQDGTFCRLALSERPADVLNVTIDRERRQVTVCDVNGSELLRFTRRDAA